MKRARADEEHVIGAHPAVLRLYRGAFDQGQQIALHALARDVRAVRLAPAGDLVDLVDEDDAVVFDVFNGLAREIVLVDEASSLLVGVDLKKLLHGQAALFALTRVDLVKDALKLVFKIVHPLRGDHVEGRGTCGHVGFKHLVVQAPLAQILAKTAPCGIVLGLGHGPVDW